MNTLNEATIRQYLPAHLADCPLYVMPLLSSTNTTARALAADGAVEGTAVVAAAQSAGRGTRARAFFSPQGGVYMSVVLRPRAEDVPLITSCAAVAVARAIERLCPLEVRIKWVNDLYLGARKVCGILTEAGVTPSDTFVVLGIGVNVAAVDFPPELSAIATSLGNEGCAVDRAALIAAILEEWTALYAAIGTRQFLAESRRRSCVLGKAITVSYNNAVFAAHAVDITVDGHLLIEKPDGERLTLQSGEVSITV